MRTGLLRKQHERILEQAKILREAISAPEIVRARVVKVALSGLAGHLKVHLAMEDESFYPSLLAHSDPKLRVLAKRFMGEMGGLRATFESYAQAWPTHEVELRFDGFAKETLGILAALEDRIRRENDELYALVDKLDAEAD